MIDVLMPFRPSTPHRVRIYRAMKKAWDAVDFPINVIVGEDDGEGPFNLAQAANRAFRRSMEDFVVLHGTDHLPPTPDKLAWVVEQLIEHPWVPLYAGVRMLNEQETERVMTDVASGQLPLNASIYHSASRYPSCTGIMAFRRTAWGAIGGMDERFCGWGCEDTALRLAAESVFGKAPLPGGDLTTLWHPRESRDRFNANAGILAEYITAHHNGSMVKYLEDR